MQDCVKGCKLWQSAQIVVKRQVLEEIVLGLIRAPDELSAQTYRL
jgi:hypothetical protein